MDVLIFWVCLGLLVELTRKTVTKYCFGKKKKEETSEEPLLKSEDGVDSTDKCRLPCCAHRWEEHPYESNSRRALEEKHAVQIAGGEEDRLDTFLMPFPAHEWEDGHLITDDSQEEELVVEIGNGKDVHDNEPTILTNLDCEARRISKGKEIVEEHEIVESLYHRQEEEIAGADMVRSQVIHSRGRKDSRAKYSAKVHPDPLKPELVSSQAPDYRFMRSGQSPHGFGPPISQSAVDYKLPGFTGESSHMV